MARKYIILKRQNKILYIEFLIAGIVIVVLSIAHYKLPPALCILNGIPAVIAFTLLLFSPDRFFRYFFSLLFSLGWALGAFIAGHYLDKTSQITAWIFAFYVFIIAAWVHCKYFTSIKKAKRHEGP